MIYQWLTKIRNDNKNGKKADVASIQLASESGKKNKLKIEAMKQTKRRNNNNVCCNLISFKGILIILIKYENKFP